MKGNSQRCLTIGQMQASTPERLNVNSNYPDGIPTKTVSSLNAIVLFNSFTYILFARQPVTNATLVPISVILIITHFSALKPCLVYYR